LGGLLTTSQAWGLKLRPKVLRRSNATNHIAHPWNAEGHFELWPAQGIQAGKPVFVRNNRTARQMGVLAADVREVQMGYRYNGVDRGYVPVEGAVLAGLAYLPGGLAQVMLPADARGTFSYWYKISKRDGSVAYDSIYGQDFNHPVVPVPKGTLRFGR